MYLALCLAMACFSSTGSEEIDTHGPRLESAERIVAVKGGGYFPVLIKMQDGSLGAVVRGGAPHVGIEGRLDWIHSEDGGKTWSPFEPVMDLPSISCNASVIRVNYEGKDILLYAGPVGPNSEITNGKEYKGYNFQPGERRSNGVVFVSYDNGKSWPFRKLVVTNQFAYSSLIELPDKTIGLFYETNFHKDIMLAKFTPDWLFEEETVK